MRNVAILAIVAICTPPAADLAGKVVGISDGDTLTVLTPDRTQVKVRLHGIDAPESGQPYGSRAKQATSELVFGKQVTVQVRDTDRYGRTVGEVILPDGRSLNRELVREGMAWHYVKYAPGDEELARLQAGAKGAGRGLWADAGPFAPWEWRSGSGVPADAGVVGNRNSKVYHAANCRSVGRMKEGNRAPFGSVAEAEAAGYRKAGDCSPR